MNQPLPKNERDFFRIASWSSALALGAIMASIYSLYPASAGVMFRFTARTVLAFLVGTAMGWIYWRLVLGEASPGIDFSARFQSFHVQGDGSPSRLYKDAA